MPKKFRIFLDSSALISGLNSPTGGAGIIISAFLAGEFSIYISNQVIVDWTFNHGRHPTYFLHLLPGLGAKYRHEGLALVT